MTALPDLASSQSILMECLSLDRLPITYKSLSRKLGCAVDQAKEILLLFSNQHPQFAKVLYVETVDDDGNVTVELLPGSKDVPEAQVVHIYSLHPSKEPQESDGLHLLDSSVSRSDTAKDIAACRPIRCSNVVYSKEKSRPQRLDIAVSTMTKASSDSALKSSSMVQKKVTVSTMSKSVSASAVTLKPSAFSKAAGGFFSKAASKKDAIGTSAKSSAAQARKKEAATKSAEAEKVLAEEEPAAPIAALKNIVPVAPIAMSKEAQRQHDQIVGMFENDTAETAVDSAVLDQNTEEMPDEELERTETEPTDSQSTAPVTTKVLKKRKVIRTETYQEGKYLKTRDVEEWETYEEEEEIVHKKAPAAPARHSLPKPAVEKPKGKAEKGDKTQRSIAGFFAKK
ncbi:hypothetical protein HDU91_006584 [Kappamyces sp. JEL0680]|nr:hypothetical protein HDU91_006584 [Kappamyces sp. JEL0680]